jgi:6-phosphogluconolactonase
MPDLAQERTQEMGQEMGQELALFAFDDRQGTCDAVASALAASVRAAHNEGRRARIALSGGLSPAPAYRAFARLDLDWSRVDIALVDDRWVDFENAGSNEAMVRDVFSGTVGVTIYGMKSAETTPFAAQATLDGIYATLRPFDGVVLGMGPDAHTASWFVGSPQLGACLAADTDQTVLGVDASAAPVSGDYPLRMTLTLPPVAEAGQIILLLYGADKKQILNQALHTPVTQAPIRAAIQASGDRCVVFWAN